MSVPAALDSSSWGRSEPSSARTFAAITLGLAVAAAILAGWVPLGFSIVTVFLFAGPHNWIEFRYFLSRMPARWGRLRGFFLLGIGGVLGLTSSYAVLAWIDLSAYWGEAGCPTAFAAWN